MSILSLDLTNPLTMIANTETDNEILTQIEKYSTAALALAK
jgi:hypothetical protein